MRTVFAQIIAKRLDLLPKGTEKVLMLIEDGSTIPFIARYRKEATGSMDEVQIADIFKLYEKLKELQKRKKSILEAIEEQKQLSPELRRKIEASWDSNEIEDLYLPFKKKRKTRASMAKEKGLEPLALAVYEQDNKDPLAAAKNFLSDEVPDVEAALQGARDIIAEWINEDKSYRDRLRALYKKYAIVKSKLIKSKEKEAIKYKDYFDFEQPLSKCPSHRMLAIRRAEEEGLLRVKIEPSAEESLFSLEKMILKNRSNKAKEVKAALHDSYKRLLSPSIETEFRKLAKERADKEAIDVFSNNLKQLLVSPPLGQKNILALDPGFRTGCKLVVIDKNGNLLEHTAIFPHPPQKRVIESQEMVYELVEKHQVEAIAIGDGTAGRESYAFCKALKFSRQLQIIMVNEDGASVYSASKIARDEFPNHDVTVRGAVSIGRRLMDPLAELVKIDPKSIGVGQYQHDVNQNALKTELDQVVESCVNAVGVNLNTASQHLLNYVSGLGPGLAKNIVEYRKENGNFKSRQELKKVKRMGAKAFEQAAGFLRLMNSAHPLDNSSVHPERYKLVKQMAADVRQKIEGLINNVELLDQIDLKKYVNDEVGLPTLKDIIQELKKPGLDPRGEVKAFEFHDKLQSIADLEIGMIVPGIISNVTKFGAFVNIGIKSDGLIHISQLANKFIKDPAEVVKLQDQVMVKVIDIDLERKRIQLSLKDV